MNLGSAQDSLQPRSIELIAVGLLSLILGFSLLLSTETTSLTNPLWFIGMLIISGAALTFIAVTFSGLGLASPTEAFALPSGSVRTLLAIGVLVLFVVFGLASVSENTGTPSEQMFTSVTFKGAETALTDEVKRYESKGLLVVPELSTDGTKLKLYRMTPVKTQATIELEKQILTALLTLVTSVVSFYFGSRTAEGAREAKGQGDSSGMKPPVPPAAEISRLVNNLSEARKRLERLQLPTTKAATGKENEFAEKLAKCVKDMESAEQVRTQVDNLVKNLGASQGSSEALASAVDEFKRKLDAFTVLLKDTENLVVG
jgi:hypothetical protein